jgi:hypothetical protein
MIWKHILLTIAMLAILFFASIHFYGFESVTNNPIFQTFALLFGAMLFNHLTSNLFFYLTLTKQTSKRYFFNTEDGISTEEQTNILRIYDTIYKTNGIITAVLVGIIYLSMFA